MLRHLILNPQGGLGNRMRAIASARRVCEMARARLTILWEWGDYRQLFNDPTVTIKSLSGFIEANYSHIRHKLENELERDERRVVPAVEALVLTTWHVFGAEGETIGREADVASWFPRPAEHIENRVLEHMARLPDRIVGIHLRRTDNDSANEDSPDELYHAEMERLADQGWSFFIATDNLQAERAMRRRYRGCFVLEKNPGLVMRWPRSFSYQDTVDDLVDLFILSRCTFIIGAHASSFSRIAIALNKDPRCKALQRDS